MMITEEVLDPCYSVWCLETIIQLSNVIRELLTVSNVRIRPSIPQSVNSYVRGYIEDSASLYQ